MKFKKKFYKNKYWRLAFLIATILLLLFVVSRLVRLITPSVANFLTADNQPAYIVQTDIPVNGELYFNNELGTTIFSDKIVAEINQAQKTLEIAVYSLKSPRLKEAIYAAAARGVEVILILDFRKKAIHDEFLFDLPVNIRRLDLGQESAGRTVLMHHKFALIDRGGKNEKLIFGSYNWTELQEKFDPSFIFISSSMELIKGFGREFERLEKGEFGPQKLKDKTYNPWDLSLSAAGSEYELWFSPGRQLSGLNNRLLKLIKEAKKEIRIMIWEFTDKTLAAEIIKQARAGIKISIITDNRNFYNTNSVFESLNAAKIKYHLDNLEIISDSPRGQEAKDLALMASSSVTSLDPFLHYHLLIVDGQKVFFGTNNWSRAGAYFNDESAIVTNDQKIIESFNDAFNINYEKNKILEK
jgi:phosphatidylserine/phosphatidylglycerophosphate/cardiolipin synthase-like enzyme